MTPLKPHRGRTASAVTSLRLIGLLGLAALVLLPLLLHAAAPPWWAARGVTVAGATANDYSAVNQGQLKNIAKQAMQELDANLPGGAGDAVHVMVDAWSFPSAATNDYSVVNLGQLKAVAKPFYDQLIAVGYTNQYPWVGAPNAANDFAAANIGQAKNLFSFNVASNIPGGIPDWWELYYFGQTGVDPNADPDGDGLTNLQEYQLGTDPTDSLNSNANFARDSDHNGLADWWEIIHFGHTGNDPNQTVAGKGGLTLKQIFDNHLSLANSSTVDDGISDSWKLSYGLDPTDPYVSAEDADGDGLTNGEEYFLGTDPTNWDTDGDSIPDGDDLYPLVPDPYQPHGVIVDVPSWDAQTKLPNPDYTKVDYTAIKVQWTASTADTTGYTVERRENLNTWHKVATVDTGTSSYNDQNLVANRHYQYRVTATNDIAAGHAQSTGSVVDYEVPLGLDLLVKSSALSRSKGESAWPEFATWTSPASIPPKYYLVDTSTSTLDGGGSSSNADSTSSNKSTGKFSYTQTNTPAQRIRAYKLTYDYDYTSTSNNTNGESGSSNGYHVAVNWSDQKRGKGHTTSDTHGNTPVSTYYYQKSNTPSSSISSFSSWTGTYQSTGTYQATSGQPLWAGDDFDLTKGSISYSGHSTQTGFSDFSSFANTSDPDSTTGYWSGTSTLTQTDSSGKTTSTTSPLNGPAWSGQWCYITTYSDDWLDNLVDTSLIQKTFQNHSASGNSHYNTDGTEVLSQEYDTQTFIQDTINDLPDYPNNWTDNYYGWAYYDWGYYGYDYWGYWGEWSNYGYPWYGWWLAQQILGTDESTYSISKMTYKFKANPSVPYTLTWYEVFVPTNDPSTPDVDESKQIVILNTRTWTLGAGQNESPEYEIDPSKDQRRSGYYTVLIQPVHIGAYGVGEAGKDITGQATEPGVVVPVNSNDVDTDGIPDYADGYNLNGLTGDSDDTCYGASFTPLGIGLTALDPIHAKIKFTYEGSDPSQVTYNASTGIYSLPGGGKIRLWLKGNGNMRNSKSVKQGGDYVTSGEEYTCADLHINGYSWLTVYVEAVQASVGVADIPIKVEVDPTGSMGYVWNDEFRVTATGPESPYVVQPTSRHAIDPTMEDGEFNETGDSSTGSNASAMQIYSAVQTNGAASSLVKPTDTPWENEHIPSTTIESGFVVKTKTIHVNICDFMKVDGDVVNLYVNYKFVETITLPGGVPGHIIAIDLKPGINSIMFQAVSKGTDGPCTVGIIFDDSEVVNTRIFRLGIEGVFGFSWIERIKRFNLEPGFYSEPILIGFPIIHMKTAYPQSAQHAREAIAKGKPVLVSPDRLNATLRRALSTAAYPKKPGFDRDEYPQAVFWENGGNADVKYINPRDNQTSGADIAKQLNGQQPPNKTRYVKNGEYVEIEVDN